MLKAVLFLSFIRIDKTLEGKELKQMVLKTQLLISSFMALGKKLLGKMIIQPLILRQKLGFFAFMYKISNIKHQYTEISQIVPSLLE